WRDQIWSPAIGLLQTFETLMLMIVADQAYDLHRASGAGILFIPDELALIDVVPEDKLSGRAFSRTNQRITQSIMTPLRDPQSPDRVVPVIITGPADAGGKIQHILLERTQDPDGFQKRRDAHWRSIAVALDLPAGAVLNSQDDAKFYNSQGTDWRAARAVVNIARIVLDPIVDKVFRPILRDQWRDPRWAERCINPGWQHLLPEADETDKASKLWADGMLTVEGYQEAAKIPAGHRLRPGTPEWDEAMLVMAATKGGFVPPTGGGPLLGQPVPASIGPAAPGTAPDGAGAVDAELDDDTDPFEDIAVTAAAVPDRWRVRAAMLHVEHTRLAAAAGVVVEVVDAVSTVREQVTAAGAPRDVWGRLSSALNRIDRQTVAVVHGAAEAATRGALRKVGAQLLSKATGTTKRACADLADTPWLVPARLGEAVVAAAIPADEMAKKLEDAFTDFEAFTAEQFEDAVVHGDESAARLLGGEPAGLSPGEKAAVVAAAALLRGRLVETAKTRMFAVTVEDDDRGERPRVSGAVPRSMVQHAAGVAGGAPVVPDPDWVEPVAGVATGPTVLARVAALAVGPVEVAYTWRTGAPAHPFKPHHDLDGVEVTRRDDPRLAASDAASWLFPADAAGNVTLGHLAPGDHVGCVCTWELSIRPAATPNTEDNR
ncbi:MAG: hypothetical protein ACRCZI_04820, partial [Cetobacterium sp.]